MESILFALSKVQVAISYPALQDFQRLTFSVVNSPTDAAGHYDYVVCVNKAINQDVVAKSLIPVVDHTTTIVIIQNGVGNEDPFRAQFPKSSILSCVVSPQKRPPPLCVLNLGS